MQFKTRFAPSPTGNMHLGNLRAAMMSFLWSIKNNSDFILRIDDTDQSRSSQKFTDNICKTLQDFGIVWSAAFKQSEQINVYKKVLLACINSGLVYPVCDTEDEIEEFRLMMRRMKSTPAFKQKNAKKINDLQCIDDAIQHHTNIMNDDTHDNEYVNQNNIYWRFKLPEKSITFQDLIKGSVTIDLKHISDPVVCKANGNFTYTFASIVDDCIEKITHIIRGADHLTNTAVQIGMIECMRDAKIMQYDGIEFAHYPLFVTKDQSKLSKRYGALSIDTLQYEFHNLSLAHYITFLSNNTQHIICDNLRDLSEHFDLSCYANANTVQFHIDDIYSWQKRIFSTLDYSKIQNWFEDGISFPYAFLKDSIVSKHDVLQWAKIMTCMTHYYCKYSLDTMQILEDIHDNSIDTYNKVVQHVVNQLQNKAHAMQALRCILIGQTKGPNLQEIFTNLSIDIIKYRLSHYKHTPLIIYSTQKHALTNFEPINHKNITLYCCGPTLYNEPHIGNYRAFIVFDVIYRLLKKLYSKVTYVRNITDVDDKIIQAAKAQGISEQELVAQCYAQFVQHNESLNILPPTVEPTVTSSIDYIIAYIQQIYDAGYAYKTDNGVYFNIAKYIADGNDYHIFSRNCTVDHNINHKDDDFVLWRAKQNDEFGWDSPWGYGRPGWHIECTVMSIKHLGAPFDIHCGGCDLQFPHHTNETAQAISTGNTEYARYWLHSQFVNMPQGKMSKSLGNIIRISDLDTHPMIIRTAMLMTHYRSAIQWSDDIIAQATSLYNKWRRVLGKCMDRAIHFDFYQHSSVDTYNSEYMAALTDDFNTSNAIRILDQQVAELEHELKTYHQSYVSSNTSKSAINSSAQSEKLSLQTSAINVMHAFDLIGIRFDFAYLLDPDVIEQINALHQAKQYKDYTLADQIKANLKIRNIDTEETKECITWYQRI